MINMEIFHIPVYNCYNHIWKHLARRTKRPAGWPQARRGMTIPSEREPAEALGVSRLTASGGNSLLYLGVDGGGTKTGFALVSEDGRIVSHTVKGSSNYVQVGLESYTEVLSGGISEVCAGAGVTPEEIRCSFLGLPAFGEIEKDTPTLIGIVGRILRHGRFRCGNDVEAGWAGSLACRPGVHLVAGTGTIGFGTDPGGHTARAGGWGWFFGDEGSAYWLGRQLVSLFSKEADGREPRTPLYDLVRAEFHLTRDFDLIPVLNDVMELKRDEIARLALLVFRAAGQGDPKALALYETAAHELSLIAKSLLGQLCFPPHEAVPVSYSGGVFSAGELILNPLAMFLAGEPIRLARPILLPVTGAALYAMKLDGRTISDGLIEELRKREAVVIQA